MKNIIIIAPICGYNTLEWGVGMGYMPIMQRHFARIQPLTVSPLLTERAIYQQTINHLQKNQILVGNVLVVGFDEYYIGLYNQKNNQIIQKLTEIMAIIQQNSTQFDIIIIDCNNPLFWFIDDMGDDMRDILQEMDRLLAQIQPFCQNQRAGLHLIAPYPLIAKNIGEQLNIFYANDYIQKRYPNQCTIMVEPFSNHPFLHEKIGQLARVIWHNPEFFSPEMFKSLMSNELFFRDLVTINHEYTILAKNNWVMGDEFAKRDSTFIHKIKLFGGTDGVHRGTWLPCNG